jgi:hypothetical protein
MSHDSSVEVGSSWPRHRSVQTEAEPIGELVGNFAADASPGSVAPDRRPLWHAGRTLEVHSCSSVEMFALECPDYEPELELDPRGGNRGSRASEERH